MRALNSLIISEMLVGKAGLSRKVFTVCSSMAYHNMYCSSKRNLYSSAVEDHYNHPRNVGKLDKNDPNVGTGLRGAPECGDMTQMQLKINPDTLVVEDVKFKAFGCGSAIAASSYASQAIRGKSLADALSLTNKQIAQELSLPPVKLHCSMLAEETIHAAVENYLSKNPSVKSKVKRNKTVDSTSSKNTESTIKTTTTPVNMVNEANVNGIKNNADTNSSTESPEG